MDAGTADRADQTELDVKAAVFGHGDPILHDAAGALRAAAVPG